MGIGQYALVFMVSAFAGMYGLIFGGGSFLTLPTLFLLGIHPITAVATNQLGSLGQMFTGSYIFARRKKINPQIIRWAAPAFLIGALIGANILIRINPDLIKKMVSLAIIALEALTLYRNPKEIPLNEIRIKRKIAGFFLIILVGAYSIVVTASSGTIMIFILMYLFGLKFKNAVENRQTIIVSGVVMAVLFLWIKGYIQPVLAIPIFLGRAVGAYLSAHIVLKAENRYLKIVFGIVVILLALLTLFI